MAFSLFVYKTFSERETCRIESLIIGTNAQFPPFEYITDGKIKGFDIDLVYEIGKRIGRNIIIKDLDFDMLLLEAQQGNIHIIAAALTPTPERAQSILFSKNYLEDDPIVMISSQTSPIKNLDDFSGKTIISLEGYSHDSYLANKDNINIIKLGSPAEAILALQTRKCDGFLTSQSNFNEYQKTTSAEDFFIFSTPYRESTALGISPLEGNLRDTINAALEEMQNDGTLTSLKQKWLVS